jgi:hypothetical protein
MEELLASMEDVEDFCVAKLKTPNSIFCGAFGKQAGTYLCLLCACTQRFKIKTKNQEERASEKT